MSLLARVIFNCLVGLLFVGFCAVMLLMLPFTWLAVTILRDEDRQSKRSEA